MAKTVASVNLTQPVGDPAITEGQTFVQGGQAVQGGSGQPPSYDMHFQWDQGTANWIDIAGAGDLNTADTNPIVNIVTYDEQTITVTGDTIGTYNVRVQTVDHRDGDALDTSGTQEVTVSEAVASDRRVFIT